MTPDLLAALRETPGCGRRGKTWRHGHAILYSDHCDPCLTRLAKAVLQLALAECVKERESHRDKAAEHSYFEGMHAGAFNCMSRIDALLTALRSETR